MKEKVNQNEKFLSFHEEQLVLGRTLEEIKQLAIIEFKLGGSDPSHTYRAWRCRLSDPAKYEGRYVERMKPFMRPRNNKQVKTAAPTPSVQPVVTTEVSEPVEA